MKDKGRQDYTLNPTPRGPTNGVQFRLNRKRVRRLMRVMGIEALVPRPGTSKAAPGAQDIPLPAARPEDCRAEPRVGGRRECAAASGVRDGGRSPAISLQERVANHRKRRWSKARVVSVTEKAPQRRQVGDRKANTREPPFKCRKCSDDVETGELCCTGISLDDACLRSRRRPA